MEQKTFNRRTTIGIKKGSIVKVKLGNAVVTTIVSYIYDLFYIGTPLGSFRIDRVKMD